MTLSKRAKQILDAALDRRPSKLTDAERQELVTEQVAGPDHEMYPQDEINFGDTVLSAEARRYIKDHIVG